MTAKIGNLYSYLMFDGVDNYYILVIPYKMEGGDFFKAFIYNMWEKKRWVKTSIKEAGLFDLGNIDEFFLNYDAKEKRDMMKQLFQEMEESP